MSSKFFPRFRPFGKSLRARVALVIALPVLIALATLSVTHYWRESRLLEEQIQLAAMHIGEVALGGLQYPMLENDKQHLNQVLDDIAEMETIQRVQIVSLAGAVAQDSAEQDLGRIHQLDEAGCRECHNALAETRPRTMLLTSPMGTLRISTPIENEPECTTCHETQKDHLGVLLIDVSLIDTRTQLFNDLRTDMIVAVGSTLVITAGVFILIHWLVVKRVEDFRSPLTAFARGEFNHRLPHSASPKDELDELAGAFNRMAEELEHHVREQEARRELRWRAIVEERERIAREIHDSIAQLMGYVNTKATAVRLMLEDNHVDEAKDQLQQLADAASESLIEVRSAILGLRMSTLRNGGLESTLKEFTSKFSELSNIAVELRLPEDDPGHMLSPESELHLLRITQEALTNVHKHANTRQAWVQLSIENHTLQLIISDDGIGFDTLHPPVEQKPHFGLATMRERAEVMGADLEIDSEPGSGTRVTIRLPLES
ncbi:MAG: HAMP domain-containing protein [Anaerolineales bacterium]|nr:HAMP domain-containing protein [Anaerolineales bacterium]